MARKFWYLAEPLPAKHLKLHLPQSKGYVNVKRYFFLFRAALTISFVLRRLRLWFFSLCFCGRSSFSYTCLYTATGLVNIQAYLYLKESLSIFLFFCTLNAWTLAAFPRLPSVTELNHAWWGVQLSTNLGWLTFDFAPFTEAFYRVYTTKNFTRKILWVQLLSITNSNR